MATFLLIHGAWHGAWCWDRVVPLLRAAGHEVIAPDLPAHGDDRAPWWRATLGAYARRACDAARPAGRVIAVGHSLGGLVISEAAAREPARFAGLVYLCAFAPRRGESLMSLSRGDPDTLVPAAARWGLGAITIRPERATAAFYHRCAPADAGAATARLCPTPILPIFQGVSADVGDAIPRAYVECTDDRAIPIALQRRMHRRFAMERVVALETDHSPFLNAPDALAERLDELAGTLGADRGAAFRTTQG
jgi:pimeloyl-ACP methyl ester carboxylesterase